MWFTQQSLRMEQEDVLVARASHLVETASSLLLSSKKEKEQSFEATGTWI